MPKSRAMPGNVVDTETISKADKKMVNINDRVTTKSFFGGIREDWSWMEMTLRSRAPSDGAASSRAVAGTWPDDEFDTEEISSVDEVGDMVQQESVLSQ